MRDLLDDNRIPFVIHEFDKHKNPTLGAFISHLSLYRAADEKGLPYIAILEDNVTIFDKLTKDSWKEVENFIDNDKRWNQLYIGGFVDPNYNKVEAIDGYKGRIYKDFNNLHGTNAYIISAKHYKQILSDPEVKELMEIGKDLTRKTTAFDIFIRRYGNRFIHKPFLFPHRVVYSTINSHLDIARGVYFNPMVVKVCQFLFFHNFQIRLVIGIVGIVLLLLIYMFIKFFIKTLFKH